MLIVDGKDSVLGRMSTFVAKALLSGEKVSVVNAEKVVISGRKEATYAHYDAWRLSRNIANPLKGPFHHKSPEDVVAATIKGMLPHKNERGRKAAHGLKVYRGVPAEFAGKEKISAPDAGIDNLGTKRYIRLEELSKYWGVKV